VFVEEFERKRLVAEREDALSEVKRLESVIKRLLDDLKNAKAQPPV
jgi:hypothetical protein